MLMTIAIIAVVSGALIVGAVWGVCGRLPRRVEGFIVAMAGGALIISAVLELVEPATKTSGMLPTLMAMLTGAVVFESANYIVDQVWQKGGDSGLLIAVTLDGIPENLALGTALIGTGPLGAAALAGSILLSNLPEAAGGAKKMKDDLGAGRTIAVWAGTAALLSASALAGNLLLSDVGEDILGLIRSFAAGAVIASLATEVFPDAFRSDRDLSGIATAIGFGLALFLSSLGSG